MLIMKLASDKLSMSTTDQKVKRMFDYLLDLNFCLWFIVAFFIGMSRPKKPL